MGDDDSRVGRVELVLARPRLGWHPRPTVVIAGRGQPAQWGAGTWQIASGDTIGVYLFNRVWRYGAAELVLAPGATAVRYRPPFLPFGRGRLTPA